MKAENAYDFRKTLTTCNKEGVCYNAEKTIKEGFIGLYGGVTFIGGNGVVIENAKKDFLDFLKVSAKIDGALKGDLVTIEFINDPLTLGEFNEYKGRVITVSENKIVINAYDERGWASALYDLELLMEREKAPILKKGQIKNKPIFSPRMTHSAFDMDFFPNEYLIKLAKEGIDAIIIFVRGINKNMLHEQVDYNDLIERANSFGLDVYAYCVLKNFHHPEEENAEQLYEEVYGKFFEAHNKLKGMIFVGESVEFPSRDEHVGGLSGGHYASGGVDNIPDGKPGPGFWPCNDYPQWLRLIKKVVNKYKPDAELVFWTYNWGYAPEEDRLKLIRELPEDITLLVTWVTFQSYRIGNAVGQTCDYTLAMATAGDYFKSEAKVAKEKNIKLYTMSNTSGRTWDFGVIPYEPMPRQWKRRYDQMREFNKLYGLKGVMECHHYGLTPSFISRFEKYCFEYGGDLTGNTTTEQYLDTVMQEFFGKDAQMVKSALEYASQAIRYYIPSDEMQYGPMRISTAYPLCLREQMKPPEYQKVYFGLIICNTLLKPIEYGRASAYSVRQRAETRSLEKMVVLLVKAIKGLEQIDSPEEQTERLLNLLRFMKCTVKTAVNARKFYFLRCKLFACESNFKLKAIIKKIKKIAEVEIANSLESIAYLEKDSSLGYEVSMGYACSKERVDWKIRQVRYMVDCELKTYENSIALSKKHKKLNKY